MNSSVIFSHFIFLAKHTLIEVSALVSFFLRVREKPINFLYFSNYVSAWGFSQQQIWLILLCTSSFSSNLSSANIFLALIFIRELAVSFFMAFIRLIDIWIYTWRGNLTWFKWRRQWLNIIFHWECFFSLHFFLFCHKRSLMFRFFQQNYVKYTVNKSKRLK